MKLLFLILLIALNGCAKMALLKNPETGDIQKCEVSTASQMLTGAFVGGLQFDKCIDEYKNAGYKLIK